MKFFNFTKATIVTHAANDHIVEGNFEISVVPTFEFLTAALVNE